jgi:hypothetical protein
MGSSSRFPTKEGTVSCFTSPCRSAERYSHVVGFPRLSNRTTSSFPRVFLRLRGRAVAYPKPTLAGV